MSEAIVKMEKREGCARCDAKCASALYGRICGITRKNVIPFIDKHTSPDWCPVICVLPEQHGGLIDRNTILGEYEYGEEDYVDMDDVRNAPILVPATKGETE